MAGGDLQGDVLDELLEVVVGHGGFLAGADFHQHADLGAGVNVGGDHAVAGHFHPRVAGDLDVLANLGHRRFAVGFEVDLGIGGEPLGHVVGEGAEHLVAGDEVGLAVHFHEHAGAAVRGDVLGDDAFAGFAGGDLAGGQGAGLAQDVHGHVDVALGFGERLLAFHHAGAGHSAQFCDECSSNFSHRKSR